MKRLHIFLLYTQECITTEASLVHNAPPRQTNEGEKAFPNEYRRRSVEDKEAFGNPRTSSAFYIYNPPIELLTYQGYCTSKISCLVIACDQLTSFYLMAVEVNTIRLFVLKTFNFVSIGACPTN